MTAIIRPITSADTEVCGNIIYEAFKGIAERHNFPLDFPSADTALQLADAWISHPQVFGVVAEENGKVVGSNFLTERNPIRGVGPITVSPKAQTRGVGRKLMEAVIERGKNATGIRLVQDSFNSTSLSLYASLGFEVKEPLVLMSGHPTDTISNDVEVRPMLARDLAECEALSKRVHGFERTGELGDALSFLKPFVAVREGRIVAYASAVTFWQLNHGVAETEDDMRTLLSGAVVQVEEPLALLVPIRQASFFRWCLASGLRVVKPMNLMIMGQYQEPSSCYFPSVEY